MNRRIFANHAHIYPAERRANGTVEALKKYLDACEIEKSVCFAPFPHVMQDAGRSDDRNEYLAAQIKNDNRFVGFGTLDFDAGKLTEQVERIADLGFKGIKIHPAAQEISVIGEKAFEVYAKAQELGLFLSFHTGIHWHRIADYKPVLFDEVAWNFPNLRFSMEHIGGYHFFREALAVICNNSRHEPQNVFAGWTSIGGSDMPGAWSLTDDELRAVVNQAGVGASIFGTDFPFASVETTRSAIARFEALNIPEDAKDGLFGKNLAQAIGIDY